MEQGNPAHKVAVGILPVLAASLPFLALPSNGPRATLSRAFFFSFSLLSSLESSDTKVYAP